MAYGKELIIDLYGCDVSKFTRESIKNWLDELCKLIDMNQEDLHFWDYEGVSEEDKELVPDHLLGISAIQFITTSDIVIHTVDRLRECYINLFSCKPFDEDKAANFIQNWFGAKRVQSQIVIRGSDSKV